MCQLLASWNQAIYNWIGFHPGLHSLFWHLEGSTHSCEVCGVSQRTSLLYLGHGCFRWHRHWLRLWQKRLGVLLALRLDHGLQVREELCSLAKD